MNHLAAPDHRLVLVEKEADRHELDPEADHGLDSPLGARDVGLGLDAHHQGHVRTIDVGVHQANARSRLRQRHGQIDAGRALADAAFARRHGDHVLHSRDQWRGRALTARDRGVRGHLHLDLGYPRQAGHGHTRLIS